LTSPNQDPKDQDDPEDPESKRDRRKLIVIVLLLLLLLGWFVGNLIRKAPSGIPANINKIQSVKPTPPRDTTVALIMTPTPSPKPGTGNANHSGGGNNNGGNNNNHSTPTPTQPGTTGTPVPTNIPTGTPAPTVSVSPTPTLFDGWVITGLKPQLKAISANTNPAYDMTVAGQFGQVETAIRTRADNSLITDFPINFNADLNWSNVDADSLGNKSFFHYPGGIVYLPGTVNNSYSLFVKKGLGTKVGVCPGAANLDLVNKTCTGIYYLDKGSPNVAVVTINGIQYWQVSGLTGTGAFSLIDPKDTLTRLQVNTASNHDLEFTSTYAVNSSGDTIVLDFVPNQGTTNGSNDWDFNGIDVGDIDLVDDGSNKTLCTGSNPCSAGAGVWGVNIDSTADTITFTAPTDAGATEIDAGSIIHVLVGLNATFQAAGNTQIINQDNVNSYEISIRIDNGVDLDFAEIEIPIIDDDTVNVTGFIDTFLTFDIDTASTDIQCDAAGGGNPCDSYGTATDNSGYVVDLGEMTTSAVSTSGASALHSDGGTGNINSIFFDLTSNATGGTAVTVMSANGALNGPGANQIPSVTTGAERHITAGSGLYGINSYAGLVNTSLSGNAVINDECDGDTGADYYCSVSTTPIEIFNTGGEAIDTLRLQWHVAASPDSLDGTGTYTDQLTFIATATF
jgi:hypothetical protein